MLEIFTRLADWSILQMGLSRETHFGEAVHFFMEDSPKIFILLYVLIFIISLFRSRLIPERVRGYLSGRSRFAGYFLAVFFRRYNSVLFLFFYSTVHGVCGCGSPIWSKYGIFGKFAANK